MASQEIYISKTKFSDKKGIDYYKIKFKNGIYLNLPLENAKNLVQHLEQLKNNFIDSPDIDPEEEEQIRHNKTFEIYLPEQEKIKFNSIINEFIRKKNIIKPIIFGQTGYKNIQNNDSIKIKINILYLNKDMVEKLDISNAKSIRIYSTGLLIYQIGDRNIVQLIFNNNIKYTDDNLDHLIFDGNNYVAPIYELNKLKLGYKSYMNSLKPEQKKMLIEI